MLKSLVVLSAFALGSAPFAHADYINGYFSAFGNDMFTSSTLTFVPGSSSVVPGIGGTFLTYLTPGNSITFLAEPGGLPYTPGSPQISPLGLPPFLTTSEGGESFSFFLTGYNASYVTPPASVTGCANGHTCLLISGTGYFTGTGTVAYDQTPATFQFDSSYVTGQAIGTVTSFAAQASATPPAPVPEPAALAMFGTGLFGLVGVVRRRTAK